MFSGGSKGNIGKKRVKKNPSSCFFEMSAFGVELMTVSIYTWINTDKCKYTKKK